MIYLWCPRVGYLVGLREGVVGAGLDFRYVMSDTPMDVARLRQIVGYPGPVAHVSEVTPNDPIP